MPTYLSNPDLIAKQQAFIEKLYVLGVTQAVITYSGYGDSGQDGELRFVHESGEILPGTPEHKIVGDDLSDDAFDFTEEIQEYFHSGYEDGEGGSGELEVNVSTGEMVMTHHDYFEDGYAEDFSAGIDAVKAGNGFLRALGHGDDEGEKEVEEAMAELKSMGVKSVHATYSGSGDSGDELTVTLHDGKGEVSAEVDIERVENVIYRALDAIVSGWEINEGSNGEMTIDLDSERVSIEHIHNSTESDTTTTKIPSPEEGYRYLSEQASESSTPNVRPKA